MKHAYERDQAERLRPLLRSIARELDERSMAIRTEGRRLRRLEAHGRDGVAIANSVAALASHKRELRHALEELEAIGCAAEPGLHSTVLVPGPDGELEHGYRLDARGALVPAAVLGAA